MAPPKVSLKPFRSSSAGDHGEFGNRKMGRDFGGASSRLGSLQIVDRLPKRLDVRRYSGGGFIPVVANAWKYRERRPRTCPAAPPGLEVLQPVMNSLEAHRTACAHPSESGAAAPRSRNAGALRRSALLRGGRRFTAKYLALVKTTRIVPSRSAGRSLAW
jgi:hypothetical protein